MTPDQAKLELDATTLRPQDASLEARAIMATDPLLADWVASRAAFDETVFAALTPIVVPAGLRDSILNAAASSSVKPRKKAWMQPLMLAAAACVVLSAAVYFSSADRSDSWQKEALTAVMSLEHGELMLDEESGSLAEIRQSLIASGAVSPHTLPATLAAAQALGCKRVKIGGNPATIICFMLESGKEAHMVVMKSVMPAGQSVPEFTTQDEWNLAAWSDEQQTFLLVTNDDVTVLKKLVERV